MFLKYFIKAIYFLQANRIHPNTALLHPFVTLAHLVDFARCDNVKASVQMMEVCRRALPDHHSSSGQAVLVPATNANVTLAFNNQVLYICIHF